MSVGQTIVLCRLPYAPEWQTTKGDGLPYPGVAGTK
jgi:hypothetical protein